MPRFAQHIMNETNLWFVTSKHLDVILDPLKTKSLIVQPLIPPNFFIIFADGHKAKNI